MFDRETCQDHFTLLEIYYAVDIIHGDSKRWTQFRKSIFQN